MFSGPSSLSSVFLFFRMFGRGKYLFRKFFFTFGLSNFLNVNSGISDLVDVAYLGLDMEGFKRAGLTTSILSVMTDLNLFRVE